MILMFPCNYISISQKYKSGTHNGLDLRNISNNTGESQDIIAPGSGTVINVRKNYQTQDSSGGSYGNYVKIDHGSGIKTVVAHLKYNTVTVNIGDTVTKGQKLGVMGSTGHSTGIHVHYEVFQNDIKINPLINTYVHMNQQTDSRSASLLKYYNDLSTKRDTSKNQLLVKVTNLSIRKNAGTEYERIGFVEQNKIYDYFDVIRKSDYTWYKIGEEKWIADDKTFLEIYEKEIIKNEYKFIYKAVHTGKHLINLNKDETLYIK